MFKQTARTGEATRGLLYFLKIDKNPCLRGADTYPSFRLEQGKGELVFFYVNSVPRKSGYRAELIQFFETERRELGSQ